MGKSTTTHTEQEFTKLHALLHQSTHDCLVYLEALKHSLSEYDHHFHLHHSDSATCFFADGLDHAKDAVKELKHPADHIRKDAGVSEVDAARHAMEQAFNALADLHKVANAFDAEANKHSDKKRTVSETVEWLVSTTRDATFSGFRPLQRQIVEVQVALGVIEKPTIKSRAMEAVHHVTDKMMGEHKSSVKEKGE